ncbi:MAG: flagellar protein FliS [Myxococcales bacterium]|nr:flagellar protein FliS [Myxococcales bacterium]
MNGFAAYRNARVFNAPNEQVVVMLFETAIHRLERAREAMVSGHRGARVEWAGDLGHVRSIFIELTNALDAEVAPELVGNLSKTYMWVVGRLGEVGRSGDPNEVDGLIRVTDTLLGAFRHAIHAVAFEDNEQASKAG